MAIYLFHINDWKYYEFADGSFIGRTHGDLVYPDDGNLSGRHAKLHIMQAEGETQIYVEDLGSKNGTMIDRCALPPERLIRYNLQSLLEVGSQRFILTDRTDLKVDVVNDIVENAQTRQAVKLDGKVLLEKNRQEALNAINRLENESRRARNDMRALVREIGELKGQMTKFEAAREEETIKAEREKVELARQFEQKKHAAIAQLNGELQTAIQAAEEQKWTVIHHAEAQLQPFAEKIRQLEFQINDLDVKADELQREADKKKAKLDRFAKSAKPS